MIHKLVQFLYAIRINRIEDVFAISRGIHDAGFAENGQVLGGYGLFNPEMSIDLGDGDPLAFIDQLDNLLSELMVQGTQNQGHFFDIQ